MAPWRGPAHQRLERSTVEAASLRGCAQCLSAFAELLGVEPGARLPKSWASLALSHHVQPHTPIPACHQRLNPPWDFVTFSEGALNVALINEAPVTGCFLCL